MKTSAKSAKPIGSPRELRPRRYGVRSVGSVDRENDFLSVWVTYEVLRRALDFDLGTMQLDGEGLSDRSRPHRTRPRTARGRRRDRRRLLAGTAAHA